MYTARSVIGLLKKANIPLFDYSGEPAIHLDNHAIANLVNLALKIEHNSKKTKSNNN
jgi:hypothetical protein